MMTASLVSWPGAAVRRKDGSTIDPRLAAAPLRRVFLKDFELLASIGVYAFEHETRQRVVINLDLGVVDDAVDAPGYDVLERVLDYEAVANRVRGLVLEGHTQLLETLCEKIARACLEDARVRVVRVRAEKPDIFRDMAAVGVEIERFA
jgi:dihydroneopterin aldolase